MFIRKTFELFFGKNNNRNKILYSIVELVCEMI